MIIVVIVVDDYLKQIQRKYNYSDALWKSYNETYNKVAIFIENFINKKQQDIL